MGKIEHYSYSDVKKEYFPNYTSEELVEELYTAYEPIDFKVVETEVISLYNRKLIFCRDIGFLTICDAIAHFGNHRIFNKKFGEVSNKYPTHKEKQKK